MKPRSSGLGMLPHFFRRRAARRLLATADRARDSRDWSGAERHYAALCRDFPLAPGLHVQRGNMLKESGRYAEARQAYEIAAWLKPSDADVWLQLGHLAKLEGRVADAAAAYRRSNELDTARPDAAAELARIETADEDTVSLGAGAMTLSRPPPRALFPSEAMLALERLKVSLAHQPR